MNPFTIEDAARIVGASSKITHGVDPFASLDCRYCDGLGYRLVPNGPDDYTKEICEECDGTGKKL